MRPEQARSFAAYNAWANRRIAVAIRTLDEGIYRADRGLAFASLHGTLNHLLVADRIWMSRLTGTAGGPLPSALDEIVEDDRERLLAARDREDARMVAYAAALDERQLLADITYANLRGERFVQTVADLLAHVFNHQTHHRGQMHAALTGLGEAAPALDYIYFLRAGGSVDRDAEPR